MDVDLKFDSTKHPYKHLDSHDSYQACRHVKIYMAARYVWPDPGGDLLTNRGEGEKESDYKQEDAVKWSNSPGI